MQYFLFRFDDSHPMKQIFWFCVILFPSLGPALFCFTVYSRSKAFPLNQNPGYVTAARKAIRFVVVRNSLAT
jgi:hypothetical protein